MSDIVKSIAVAIGKKGINAIHPMKEMLCDPREVPASERIKRGLLTPRQLGNITHVCRHGLVTRLDEPGTFCLTRKGAAFLRGEAVPLVAIIDKRTHHNIGYVENKDGMPIKTTIHAMQKSGDYWEGIGYDIVEGNVIQNLNK